VLADVEKPEKEEVVVMELVALDEMLEEAEEEVVDEDVAVDEVLLLLEATPIVAASENFPLLAQHAASVIPPQQ